MGPLFLLLMTLKNGINSRNYLENPMLAAYWQSLYNTSQSVLMEEQGQAPVKINHHLNALAYVASDAADWHPSPAKGVKRIMLERDGGEETLRATSIVAYAPGSRFSRHSHPLGEEFLVLHGTFSDENGDYPAGTYVRNPPGSSHAPFSENGCMIWVKLQQFSPDDHKHVVTCITETANSYNSVSNNIASKLLFSNYEKVMFQTAIADTNIAFTEHHSGVEILLLSGNVNSNALQLTTGSWCRFPSGEALHLAPQQNAEWLIKIGHLE